MEQVRKRECIASFALKPDPADFVPEVCNQNQEREIGREQV
jgi:hypothetical protein